MFARSASDNERWMEQGTKFFLDALAGVDDASLLGPSGLAGWTGRHLVAHVAANADALSNLVRWAATGEETPMYASPEQRNADIEAGALRAPVELRAWVASSAALLEAGFADLGSRQRASEVRTAQGRLVPASEVAWLRAREVMVHSVDLRGGVSFADLPADFLAALAEDIVAKRSSSPGPALLLVPADIDWLWVLPGASEPVKITAPLAELTAYLAGRPSSLDGTDLPRLPRWL